MAGSDSWFGLHGKVVCCAQLAKPTVFPPRTPPPPHFTSILYSCTIPYSLDFVHRWAIYGLLKWLGITIFLLFSNLTEVGYAYVVIPPSRIGYSCLCKKTPSHPYLVLQYTPMPHPSTSPQLSPLNSLYRTSQRYLRLCLNQNFIVNSLT